MTEDASSKSLVAADGKQMRLDFPDIFPEHLEDKEGPEKSELRQYTAKRLYEQRPDTYRAVVFAMAAGFGQNRVAKYFGISVHTLRQVMYNESSDVATLKQELAEKMRMAAQIAVEEVIEDLSDPVKRDKIPTDRKAIIAGVLTDKSLVLSGEASSIVGHTSGPTAPTIDDYNARLAAAKKVFDVETVSGGTISDQREDPPKVLGSSDTDPDGTCSSTDEDTTHEVISDD